MTRKQFIESQGATCKNWTWSWSFVNEKDKVIIFGAWDSFTQGDISLIMSQTWAKLRGRKQPGYEQSIEHIRLLEEEGYQLKTFPLIYSEAHNRDGVATAKIKGFTPELTNKSLTRIGDNWYAIDNELGVGFVQPEEVNKQYFEGAKKTITVNAYERNPEARAKCLEHHGYICSVCSFDFEKFYGILGKKYIHVHHVNPIHGKGDEYELNPIEDLVPVCPNCHAMIHRTSPILKVEELKKHLEGKNTIN